MKVSSSAWYAPLAELPQEREQKIYQNAFLVRCFDNNFKIAIIVITLQFTHIKPCFHVGTVKSMVLLCSAEPTERYTTEKQTSTERHTTQNQASEATQPTAGKLVNSGGGNYAPAIGAGTAGFVLLLGKITGEGGRKGGRERDRE